MKKISNLLCLLMIATGSLHAGHNSLDQYSSVTLFVAAAKHVPRDIKSLAKNTTKSIQKQTFRLCTFVKNNRTKVKKLAVTALIVGSTYSIVQNIRKENSRNIPLECSICTTTPKAPNRFLITPCCHNYLCQECTVAIERTYNRDTRRHYKHCPFCREDISSMFVE